MKLAQITVGLVAFVAGGAASFAITRTVVGGGSRGGVATREGLVAATVEGVNAGDREALLDIMVGPASDRDAAACDDDAARDAAARDARRGERVDDALDEAKRRRLVLDHVGDDHAEVVAHKGDELDKHCKARIDVVKHDMEIALHDGKSIQYTAHLPAIELAGRWYLATIPLAVPVGDKAAAVAVAPPVPTPPPTPTPTPTPPAPAPTTPPAPAHAAPPARVERQEVVAQTQLAITQREMDVAVSKAPPKCTAYIKELQRLLTCQALSESLRAGFQKALDTVRRDMFELQRGIYELGQVEPDCQEGLSMLRKNNFGC